jgi:hypothetical protein
LQQVETAFAVAPLDVLRDAVEVILDAEREAGQLADLIRAEASTSSRLPESGLTVNTTPETSCGAIAWTTTARATALSSSPRSAR